VPISSLPFDPIDEARRQWLAHDWDEPDAMAAVTSIMRGQQIMLARVDRVLRPLRLNFARFEMLVLLHFSSRGRLPLGKMGERLQVHATTVTNTVDRLEMDGLVRRVPHPPDRRTTLAEITPAGRALLKEATPIVTGTVFADTGLSPTELRHLFALLRKLRSHAGDFDPAADAARTASGRPAPHSTPAANGSTSEADGSTSDADSATSDADSATAPARVDA
jgi:DNA-binding MarR family transcriptional regulator